MKPIIKVEFTKFIYDEKITYNKRSYTVPFANSLLDFICMNIKELLTSIDITNISQLDNLFNKDSMLIAKIFYADEIKRQLQNSDLSNTDKNKRIKKILDIIENKQKLFSTIIHFCFLLNDDKYSYERQLDKLIFICNKLGYSLEQPRYSYSITTNNIPLSTNLKLDNITETTLNEFDKEYLKFKQTNHSTVNHYENIIYTCESVDELFCIEMLKIFERKYKVLRCKNCGKLFVPARKSDALYCDRNSPQNETMSCKRFASQQPQGVSQLYKKIYMKKSVRAKRHKDDFTITNEFEKWKTQVDKKRADYNKGVITADEFEKWLLDNDK